MSTRRRTHGGIAARGGPADAARCLRQVNHLLRAVTSAWLIAACTSASPAPAPPPAPVPAPPTPVVSTPSNAPPTLPREGKISVGAAGELWYRVVGAGADTVIVPLGAYLGEALAPLGRERTLLFYDPWRRGRSDPFTDTTLSRFDADVSDLEAVRAALGVSRAAIVGFSYYGAVAAAYAARHPDRVSRLVLVSPIEPNDSLAAGYNPAERMTRIDTTRARAMLKRRAAGADTVDPSGYCLEYWRVNAPLFVGDSARAERITPTWCELANESPRYLADHLRRSLASLGTTELMSVAPRITAPTLIVQGDRDYVVNPAGAAAWARAMSNARVVTVRGAGHFAFIEDPQGVLRAIEQFLSGR